MWRPDNMSCTQTHIYKAHATCNSWRAHPAELLETNCRRTDCSAVGHNLTGATRVNHGSTATKTSLQTSTFHFTTTTTVNRPSHLSWETECLPAILPAIGDPGIGPNHGSHLKEDEESLTERVSFERATHPRTCRNPEVYDSLPETIQSNNFVQLSSLIFWPQIFSAAFCWCQPSTPPTPVAKDLPQNKHWRWPRRSPHPQSPRCRPAIAAVRQPATGWHDHRRWCRRWNWCHLSVAAETRWKSLVATADSSHMRSRLSCKWSH